MTARADREQAMAKSLGELQGNIEREPIEMPDGNDYRLKDIGDWSPDDWREHDEDMEAAWHSPIQVLILATIKRRMLHPLLP